ncbi:unnamed protein product [Thelazia callipaeda]|uniref:Amiloride-sensitive sodium channel n=1 Tax=Thelazia callipaeda TaxID=103827 RepID=A0A0N5CJF3_THECL|nr:unnamed protein product [Thelazia callipaeda]
MFERKLLNPSYHKGPNWKALCSYQKWTKYILWSLIAFLAGLTVRDVLQLCSQFISDPKQTAFKMIFNESMSMPNLTFCISKDQAFSHFNLYNMTELASDWDLIVEENLLNMTSRESFLNSAWDFRVIIEAYEVIAAISSIERETSLNGSAHSITYFRIHPAFQEKRRLVQIYLNAIKERNVTFSELTQKTGTEILKRLMKQFARLVFSDEEMISTDIRISWISQMQMCFQPLFSIDNFKPIEDQGPFFVLLMSHNTAKLNGIKVDCMSVDFHGRPSSIARFMQGKNQVMDGFIDDLCLGLRHEVFISVRIYYEMIENDNEGTACRDIDDSQENEFECHSRCRLQMIREMCNCTAHSLSYLVNDDMEYNQNPLCNYTKCIIDQRQKYDEKECTKSCFRNCKQIRFQIDRETNGPMLQKDLTMIRLNWRSFEYLSLEQDRVYSITSFIAELGGSIGVWLGLSVLSLFQVVSL